MINIKQDWAVLIYTLFVVFIISGLYQILKNKNTKSPFVRFLPNILTALGILGTFITLSIAFYNLDISDKTSVNNLPSILGIAFITSILGIISSHIFSLILSSFDKKETESKEYHTFSPEEVLYRLMKNSEEQNEKIIKILSTTSESVQSLDGKLSDSISDIVDNFSTSMKEMQNSMMKNMNDVTDKMHKQISDSLKVFNEMSKTSSKHFKQLNER
jgi:biopolymer transport protein ExbB/TolQ